MSNTAIITQARMTSTRLPGKIMKTAGGKTLLEIHVERLKQTCLPVIIATTTNKTDDEVANFAEKNNIGYFRGDENNVLSRYMGAALKFELETIIRVTSDCPLIDPQLIRDGVKKFEELNDPYAYVSNGVERTFARGFDFEVFSFSYLKQAYDNATDPLDLEHVTPYIWKNRSGQTVFQHFKQQQNNSHYRITVDTPEDLELLKVLIEKYNAAALSHTEIENILDVHPELSLINAHIEQKKT